jgi:hypothetical protein
LSQGYGVFAAEARHLDPDDRAATVNTDGWGATKIAWTTLFPQGTDQTCFTHPLIMKPWIGEKANGAY